MKQRVWHLNEADCDILFDIFHFLKSEKYKYKNHLKVIKFTSILCELVCNKIGNVLNKIW